MRSKYFSTSLCWTETTWHGGDLRVEYWMRLRNEKEAMSCCCTDLLPSTEDRKRHREREREYKTELFFFLQESFRGLNPLISFRETHSCPLVSVCAGVTESMCLLPTAECVCVFYVCESTCVL